MELQVNDLFIKIGVLTVENDMLKLRVAELEKQLQPQVTEAPLQGTPRGIKNVTPGDKG